MRLVVHEPGGVVAEDTGIVRGSDGGEQRPQIPFMGVGGSERNPESVVGFDSSSTKRCGGGARIGCGGQQRLVDQADTYCMALYRRRFMIECVLHRLAHPDQCQPTEGKPVGNKITCLLYTSPSP